MSGRSTSPQNPPSPAHGSPRNSDHACFAGKRGNWSVGPTHFFFPELDYSVRKFTRPDASASAGLRPHFK